MATDDWIQVQLVCAWPERAYVYAARVHRGTTARELLLQSRAAQRFPEWMGDHPNLGVFGRRVELDYVLAAGDRVELLRDLTNDPKEARRRRAMQAGTARARR